ncbi:MAG: hypothetical protein QOJ29_72 [Thermoleophilaceae bacterium]|nr:hypothetical protein [Thermoleophilaceae bacterium]
MPAISLERSPEVTLFKSTELRGLVDPATFLEPELRASSALMLRSLRRAAREVAPDNVLRQRLASHARYWAAIRRVLTGVEEEARLDAYVPDELETIARLEPVATSTGFASRFLKGFRDTDINAKQFTAENCRLVKGFLTNARIGRLALRETRLEKVHLTDVETLTLVLEGGALKSCKWTHVTAKNEARLSELSFLDTTFVDCTFAATDLTDALLYPDGHPGVRFMNCDLGLLTGTPDLRLVTPLLDEQGVTYRLPG